MEKWKDIDGYDGVYQVSSFGNFRSKAKGKKFRLLKPQADGHGYFCIRLYKDKVGKTFHAHRLVIKTFLGDRDCPHCGMGLEVNHKDANKTNNRLTNLEYVTRKDNMNQFHANLCKSKENV